MRVPLKIEKKFRSSRPSDGVLDANHLAPGKFAYIEVGEKAAVENHIFSVFFALFQGFKQSA
jgi:hypothetical protein